MENRERDEIVAKVVQPRPSKKVSFLLVSASKTDVVLVNVHFKDSSVQKGRVRACRKRTVPTSPSPWSSFELELLQPSQSSDSEDV